MLKSLLLSALVLTGCAAKSEPGPPRELKWQLPTNHSLAYRIVAASSAIVAGESKDAERFTGYLFVDVDGEGNAALRLEPNRPILATATMKLRPASSNFFFPLPESGLGSAPLVQSLTIAGLGTTATRSNPDIQLSETLSKTADDGKRVTLTFTRTGSAAGKPPVGLELEESGQGTFDLEAGRYQRLQRTTRMEISGEFGGERADMTVTVELSMEFDAARSKTRSEETARLREPPVSASELARYLEDNPPKAEIARAVRNLNDGQPRAALVFHLAANPVATWQEAMTLPADQAARLASIMSVHVGQGRRLPQPLVDWLKRELANQPALASAVANLQDERLRQELARLSSATAPSQAWTAKRAGESLAAIDAQKAGPASLLAADEEHFLQLGHALQAEGQDHRGLVPVLIELLARSEQPSSPSTLPLADICVQWLEGLTSRSFGKDVAAWQAFWQANRSKPYCQWMIEATVQETPLLVHNALSRLALCAESAAATELLAARLESGSDDTRPLAARALAAHKDRRAILVLVDMLAGGDPGLRNAALVALANFHTTTLGYDPAGDVASRAQAARRWRAWARVSAAEPAK